MAKILRNIGQKTKYFNIHAVGKDMKATDAYT